MISIRRSNTTTIHTGTHLIDRTKKKEEKEKDFSLQFIDDNFLCVKEHPFVQKKDLHYNFLANNPILYFISIKKNEIKHFCLQQYE